jgi:hypothetical protein
MPDEGYERTRAFYAALGFLPLEETLIRYYHHEGQFYPKWPPKKSWIAGKQAQKEYKGGVVGLVFQVGDESVAGACKE